MVIEIAQVAVLPGHEQAFEEALATAGALFALFSAVVR